MVFVLLAWLGVASCDLQNDAPAFVDTFPDEPPTFAVHRGPTSSVVRVQGLWNDGQLGTAMGRPALYNGLVFVQCAPEQSPCFPSSPEAHTGHVHRPIRSHRICSSWHQLLSCHLSANTMSVRNTGTHEPAPAQSTCCQRECLVGVLLHEIFMRDLLLLDAILILGVQTSPCQPSVTGDTATHMSHTCPWTACQSMHV